MAEDYIVVLNTGVKAERIPYRAGSGAKSSKYIDGLIAYFRSKGNSEKESKSFAFATAKVQKREGLPTRASFRFSTNGHRTQFIERAWDQSMPKIVLSILDDAIELIQITIINEFEKT